MEAIILKHVPNYWIKSTVIGQYDVSSEEFNDIAAEIRKAGCSIAIGKIKRYQNIYDYGQVLIREQLLSVMNPGRQYYRVRRYFVLEKCRLSNALEYNLDYRRIGRGTEITFSKSAVANLNYVIIVVQIITDNYLTASIIPKNNADFFIEYIVEFQD